MKDTHRIPRQVLWILTRRVLLEFGLPSLSLNTQIPFLILCNEILA